MDSSGLIQDPESPLNLTALAMDTEGYSAMDLKDFVSRAVHQAAIRASNHEHEEDYRVRFLLSFVGGLLNDVGYAANDHS